MLGLSASVISLLLGAVENAPAFFDEVKPVFDEIGAAEGGVARLIKAAASFAALAGHAANSAQAAHTGANLDKQPQIATSQQSITGRDYSQGGGTQSITGRDYSQGGGTAVQQPPVVVTDGGSAVDANGNPILNAADQAAKQAQE